MSVTLSDLILSVRERSGIQNSDFISDDELAEYVNEGTGNLYDTIVEAYAPYFLQTAEFTLDSTGEIELDSIINPEQMPALLVPQFATIDPSTTEISMFYSGDMDPPPAFYSVISFTVSPGSACTTGNTTFEIYVNGVATGCAVTVPNGSSADQVNTAVIPTFQDGDSIKIKVTSAGSGSSWPTAILVNTQESLNKPRFYKELGVDWLGNGPKLSVPRLSSFMHRNDGNLQTIPIAGPYKLHYIPSCPVLTDVIDLPVELERWKNMIILEGQCKVYQKRKLDFGDIRQELNYKKKEIQNAMRVRVNEPKPIPTRLTSAGCGRSFDILGSKLVVFSTTGNSGNWNGFRYGFGGW